MVHHFPRGKYVVGCSRSGYYHSDPDVDEVRTRDTTVIFRQLSLMRTINHHVIDITRI
jgi:hypothetical protein